VPYKVNLQMSREDQSNPADVPGLARQVYDDLHRIAGEYLRHERVDHTLQPTALVHEAYLKVAKRDDWKSATHFRAVASRAMRQVLVDHARRRGRLKRGGERLMLTTNIACEPAIDVDVLAVDEALEALAQLDERKARVVELRFFGGLTARESADVLGISQKTAEADWYFARAWLHDRLDTPI
jgi:RNA polymerase sigma factor (TIGR02999 family)